MRIIRNDDSGTEARRVRLLADLNGYVDLDMFDEAQKCAKRLIATGAGDAASFLECGSTYHTAGKHDRAIFFYRLAIRTDPKCREAYTNLGFLLEKQRRFDEAIECYRSQLSATPDDPWAYNNLGIVYCYQKKDFIFGIPFLERGHRNDPENVIIHHNLAWAYYNNREYEKALTEYGVLFKKFTEHNEWFLENYSHTSEIFADFALTCFKLNRHKTARDAIRWAMELRPANRKEWDKKYREIYKYLRRNKGVARRRPSRIKV